jgi:23S rRNA (pseudouridine1915-N3)-methyltransferase
MKIKIIVVGKTKEQFLQQGEQEFQWRLTRYCQLEQVIVKKEKIVSNSTEQITKLKEAERILAQVTRGSFIIALDREGDQLSSEELAEFLQQKMNEGYGEVIFIIGGTLGLGETVLKSAAKVLSLSKMTFTHEMSRLILLEQLYRAFTLLKGTKYHKA